MLECPTTDIKANWYWRSNRTLPVNIKTPVFLKLLYRDCGGVASGTVWAGAHQWRRCACACAAAGVSQCEPSGWVSSGSTPQPGTGRPARQVHAHSTAGKPGTQTRSLPSYSGPSKCAGPSHFPVREEPQAPLRTSSGSTC